jgi:hypothetical protein
MLQQILFSLAVLTTLGFSAAHAQPRTGQAMMTSVDPALFKGLRYRLVGPSRGGRVTTVTGVPSQPKTFHMALRGGGLFRTTEIIALNLV